MTSARCGVGVPRKEAVGVMAVSGRIGRPSESPPSHHDLSPEALDASPLQMALESLDFVQDELHRL